MKIAEILKNYDPGRLTVGVLGGHSALDVCAGVKKAGFRSLVVAQKGREKTYSQYYKTRVGFDGKEKGCVDEVLVVDHFKDVVREEVQEKLRALNTIFVHNRYFWVYCDFAEIEKSFRVPIYGLREGVKLEERNVENNQYILLRKAGIRIPQIVRAGGLNMRESECCDLLRSYYGNCGSESNTFDEDGKRGCGHQKRSRSTKRGPLIVKVNEAHRSYERAFFVINSPEQYLEISRNLIKGKKILASDLSNAVIEEYILGAHLNLNFFYSPLTNELELLGTDTRRQTNLDGFLRLPASEQLNLERAGFKPKMVENGHYAVTMKESLVEKAFDLGEKFLVIMREEYAPGLIGPFALQGAVVAEEGKEEFVIFDVSMRIPGSPGTKFTPYSGYLYGESLSYGERIGQELKNARDVARLGELLT